MFLRMIFQICICTDKEANDQNTDLSFNHVLDFEEENDHSVLTLKFRNNDGLICYRCVIATIAAGA